MLRKMDSVYLRSEVFTKMPEQRSVVVTGASTGIGYAIAKVLGKNGIEVFGGVRKQADAEPLLRELDTPVKPLLDKAQEIDLSRYDNTDYAPILKRFIEYFMAESKKGLHPDRIGEAVYTALTTRKPKLRYAVVPQRFKNWTVPMALPKRWLDRMIGKQTGLLPKRGSV